jgi:hypothetical protein
MATYFTRLMLALLFGSPFNAEEALLELKKMKAEKILNRHFNYFMLKFYAALACYSLAPKSGGHSSRYRRLGNRKLRDLSKYAEKGCTNVHALVSLLNAEKQVGRAGAGRLISAFEMATTAARNSPYKQLEGICCERLGLALK